MVFFRVIWGVLFVTAQAACMYYFVNGLIKYYNYPIATKFEYVQVEEIDFPSVTICNYNQIRKSFVEEQNDSVMDSVADLLNPVIEPEDKPDISNEAIKKELQSVNLGTVGVAGGHRLEDMFVECSFMATNSSKLPCKFHKEMFRQIKTTMGLCYIFHPQSYIEKYGALKSTRTGFAGGLHFAINIQQYEYLIGNFLAGIKVSV